MCHKNWVGIFTPKRAYNTQVGIFISKITCKTWVGIFTSKISMVACNKIQMINFDDYTNKNKLKPHPILRSHQMIL